MLIRRIRVSNFRKIEAPVDLPDLGPGLTVIAGDNEAGKSTLLDAVRAVLFERHTVGGKVLDDMLPFGAAVRPEIGLDFEIDGAAYALSKAFRQRPEARLQTPAGLLTGPEAEERLAELLQFDPVTGGGIEKRRESRGILGLFWLEQGHVHHGLGLGSRGQRTVRGALEEEVGDVLGGSRGQRLLARARELRAALLTPTGRPTGRLAAAEKTAETAAAEAAELARRLAEYEGRIDRLARARDDLERFAGEDRLAASRRRLAEAEELKRALDGLDARVAARRSERDLAASRAENAAARTAERQRLIEELAAAETAIASLAERSGAARQAETGAKERERTATEDAAAARRRQAEASARLARAEAAERRRTRLARQAELARLLARAGESREARRAAGAALAGIRVTAEAVTKLRQLDAALASRRAVAAAASTRIVARPEPGRRALLDGVPLPEGEEVALGLAAELTLPGWGRLEIRPGTSEAAAAEGVGAAEAALAHALGAAGAATLAEAEALLDRRRALEQAAGEAERTLRALAPDGIERLEDEAATLAAALGDAPGTEIEPDPQETMAALSEQAAAAAAAVERSGAAVAEAARAAAAASAARAGADAALAAATAQRDADARRLDAARGAAPDAGLAQGAAEASAALGIAEQALAAAVAAREAAAPEAVRLGLEAARDALAQAEREDRRLREEIIRLETELAATGGSGLGEAAARAAALAGRAAAEQAALAEEAAALDLLVVTLARAEATAKETFLGPVRARVAPFLRLVLPDATLCLADDLEIAGIERAGRIESFERLSVGTREQISVLVRLAFATYLRERGMPAAVILDDCLVYADRDRFERMHLALRKAAETVQVLILTCRPDDWHCLGAPVRRLEVAPV